MGEITLVILNAGDGGRLGLGVPKGCMIVNGEPLASRIARLLPIPDPIMVIGHRAADVRDLFGNQFRYVVNPEWRETKTGGSLLCAQHLWGRRPTLVVAADHAFGRDFAQRAQLLMYSHAGILVDAQAELDGEEQVLLDDWTLAWPVPQGRKVIGEVPEVFWLRHGWIDISKHEDIFEGFNRRNDFVTIGTAGAPWVEVDTMEDLQRARRLFGE